eukprot:CCRYP_014618-RA/>CCRYP_014618-RA protein AED:0.29 eAED:0.29 QI:0/0/0/1/0.5/0.33/3/0/697
MGIKQDVEDSLKDYPISTIDGQPDEEALSKLKLELVEGLASIPTLNGGGQHGHIGMILSTAEYTAISRNGAPYDILDNPGPYPLNVDATDAVNRERQVAEHKGEIKEYEMQLGAISWARKAIIGAVEECWLSEIKNPHVGFNHLTPFELLTHLESVGGTLDFMDITELQAELFTPWDQVEAPTSLFERQDKIEKQLVKAGIPAQPELRLALARTWFENTGEYDIALAKWDNLPATNRTLPAFRVMIQKEFAKRTKRDKQTAKGTGRGLANNVTAEDEAELQAMAMAEIVNAVTAQSNAQMEKMMEMLKTAMSATQPGTTPNPTTTTRAKCPHCNLRHPKPDECWELAKNAAKRVSKWARRVKKWKERRKNRAEEEALLDSAATSSFVKSSEGLQLTGKSTKMVSAANGGLMPPATALLGLSNLRDGARAALVVPGLKPTALMGVSPLADNGYTTIFHPHKKGVTVHDANSFELTLKSPPVLQGCRNAAGLWTVPIRDDAAISQSLNIDEAAMNVYEATVNKGGALGFLTKATLLTAAKHGNLVTFPGLTPENINKHFPESDETQKGHMRQSRQGVRSTKVLDEDMLSEVKPTPGIKKKDVYLRVFDATRRSMYTDQSGPFPIMSKQKHRYIMVAVELDGNYIDAEPLKTRSAKDLTDAYQKIFSRWKATESFALIGTCWTTKHLRVSSKQFGKTIVE